MITFLDCTLRDGGYYNDWDFDVLKAEQLVHSLNDAGVQIIELGYKSPVDTRKFYGLFKNCNEEYLGFLSKNDSSDYAFMIDVKEFLTQGRVDEQLLDQQIKPADSSIFTWVRLASHFATVESIPEFVAYFRKRGYKVGFNLMGGSLLSDDQVLQGLRVAERSQVDVFYIADSFGSFYPDDIRRIVRFIKKNYEGVIGIHTHDNQGMAYANTITAIEEGVDFVDGTVTGMGRGAGNLLTEQFLLGHSIKNNDSRFDASALFQIIENYIQPLKDLYKWGYNTSYMYSGLLNIHPTYGQELSGAGRFTSAEISDILSSIPADSRKKYNNEALNGAIRDKISRNDSSGAGISRFDLKELSSDHCFILAKGKEAQSHIPTLKKVANKLNASIVECNHTGYLEADTERILVILNQLKLHEWMDFGSSTEDVKVVTGRNPDGIEHKGMYLYPFSLGNFKVDANEIVIPDYDAGLYAIALAMAAGIKNIYLVGFDGYSDADANQGREIYLQAAAETAKHKQVKIIHVTRSNYQVFDQQSLYTL